jgi:hypothetical protein
MAEARFYASILLDLLAAYAIAGAAVALPFAAIGIARILPPGEHVTIGARILMIPGVVAFWPLILRRWMHGQAPG